MDYSAMIEEYTKTVAQLRTRTADLRLQEKTQPFEERDKTRRRLTVMQEEMYDMMLVQLELMRRQREENEVKSEC